MVQICRRAFVQKAGLAAAGAALLGRGTAAPAHAQVGRRMTMALSPGAIGVRATQIEAIELAAKYGFESVDAFSAYLASLDEAQLADLLGLMKTKGVTFGAAGLPVDFRKDETAFAGGMKELPRIAAGLRRAGVTRMTTWIMPCHDTLTYAKNFRQHATRLREVGRVLGDHGIRLGLEYVGPKTLWTSKRYPFLHTLGEALDLIQETGAANIGVLLDSYHWWTAGDTEADILALRAEQVVSLDLNDGAAGVPREEQIDGKRELPCATGAIDLAIFLNAVHKIGFDGPARAEPFNKALNDLENDAACAATAEAMKKAFALIRA